MLISRHLRLENNDWDDFLFFFSFPVPPEILVPLSDVTCDKGECVTLRCKVCGRPKAAVTWKGPDQSTLSNNGHFSIAYRYVRVSLYHIRAQNPKVQTTL